MSLVKKYSKEKSTCKVTFSLPKEAVQGGKNVVLVGEFNNWNPAEGIALVNKKNGYETVIELTSGRKYEYRYLVDGRTWVNDFKADAYVPNAFGTENSVVAIPTAKKVTAKKTTAKKVTAKKTVTKKATPTAKKVTAKKTVTKKATPTAKKVTAKKTVAKKATPTAKKVTAKKTVAKKTTPAKKKVVAKKATKIAVTKLTKIEGIGPKIQTLLNKAGIKTFTDLSKAKVTTLRTILKDAGNRFQMHDPSTWAKQAKLAAKGNWDKLNTLQDELKGGRK